MDTNQLAAEIVDRARYYSGCRDLFQKFVDKNVSFVRVGDEIQIRTPFGETLIISSESGYVRNHLAIETLEEWERYGLVNRVEGDEEITYRLTDTGRRLGQ
jgi:hypothetical protein